MANLGDLGSGQPRWIGRRHDPELLDRGVGRFPEQLDERRQRAARQVGPRPTLRRREQVRRLEDRGRADLGADGQQQGLLTRHAAIVRILVSASGIGERRPTIHVLLPGLDSQDDVAPDRIGVLVVIDRRWDVDIDAAHRVDDLDHTHEIGDEHRIDGSAGQFGDDPANRADALHRAAPRPAIRVARRGLDIHLVEQALHAAAGNGVLGKSRRERRVLDVARQADHGDLAGGHVDLDQQHHVHPPTPAVASGVGAEQEQVEPAVVAPGGAAGRIPRNRGPERRQRSRSPTTLVRTWRRLRRGRRGRQHLALIVDAVVGAEECDVWTAEFRRGDFGFIGWSRLGGVRSGREHRVQEGVG